MRLIEASWQTRLARAARGATRSRTGGSSVVREPPTHSARRLAPRALPIYVRMVTPTISVRDAHYLEISG